MTEILTESFCERCGTRYTFQSAVPGRRRMKRLKVLSRGLKNYVLSDETTLEEAFADARGDEERAISSGQLDAFHQTFNFCMSCRQYTCENCWNGPENLCLTCSPDLSQEVLPAAFPDLDPMAGVPPMEAGSATAANEDRAALLAVSAWPEADLHRTAEPGPGAEEMPAHVEAEVVADHPEAPEPPVLAAAIAAAAIVAAEPETDGEAIEEVGALGVTEAAAEAAETAGEAAADVVVTEAAAAAPRPPQAPDERAAVAAAQTAALLARFRPDRSLDQALAAYEQEAEAQAAPAEPVAGPVVDVEPMAPAAGELVAEVAAEVEVEAEPFAEAETLPSSTEAEVAAAPAERRDDRVEIPTWRIVAPDSAPTEPAVVPPGAAPSTTPPTPAWPPAASAGGADGSAPQWPSAPFLAAAPSAVRARDAMWAASSLEIVEKAGGGVQSCVSCGLPLSATARFCRRCGSRQG